MNDKDKAAGEVIICTVISFLASLTAAVGNLNGVAAGFTILTIMFLIMGFKGE